MAGSKTPAKTSKAKGKKATERKTPTVAEQAQRNAEIVAAKARGLGWTQISATYGLTVRRCQ